MLSGLGLAWAPETRELSVEEITETFERQSTHGILQSPSGLLAGTGPPGTRNRNW
jgi:hypothetical protein